MSDKTVFDYHDDSKAISLFEVQMHSAYSS